ncbi:hypothetical protein [Serratia odorifera]|uniref:hypothetical protein n=1 Tax=Serratia odorifera TaxID=618 RepID=UPI0018E7D820|nr:hypothetical protein [Serratia odorifera]MBJ2068119.1 hypothetical protein [Serratia odorifera]
MGGNTSGEARCYVYTATRRILREILTEQQKVEIKSLLQKHYDAEAKLYHRAPEELKIAIQKEMDVFFSRL